MPGVKNAIIDQAKENFRNSPFHWSLLYFRTRYPYRLKSKSWKFPFPGIQVPYPEFQSIFNFVDFEIYRKISFQFLPIEVVWIRNFYALAKKYCQFKISGIGSKLRSQENLAKSSLVAKPRTLRIHATIFAKITTVMVRVYLVFLYRCTRLN